MPTEQGPDPQMPPLGYGPALRTRGHRKDPPIMVCGGVWGGITT